MAEVLVVGAGLGGLSAAVVLAARGQRVTVLEAGPRAGGKADVVTLDGVEVDTGPSVLTLPQVLDAVLREAGTRLEDELTLRQPEPAFRYHFPGGGQVDFHHHPEDTLRSVGAALGASAAAELRAFLEHTRHLWSLSAPAFVFGPAPGADLLTRLGPWKMARFLELDPMRSMWSVIQARVRTPELRAILARFATYNGSDVRQAPGTLNCIAWVELGLGGYGVQGGVYALVRALERAGARLGVQYRYTAAVAELLVTRGRARGVRLQSGERLHADAVVSNADLAHLAQDLLPSADLAPAAAPDRPSMSGWNAILRAARTAEPRPAHAVLFPPDYVQEFVDLFDHDRPPQVPTVYLCAQEACHGRSGWPDAEPLFVMANAPPEPPHAPRDPAIYSALGQRVRARLECAGLVRPEDAVLWERRPAELADRFPRSRGALYGASSNSMLAAFRRAGNRAPRLPGLYLASGSAHPGGGMPLCIQSGRMAARLLLEDLGQPLPPDPLEAL